MDSFTRMALRSGRKRSNATPIIAKGSVYPLQNQCASKSATHGFASKSDTRHNRKATRKRGFSVGWDGDDVNRAAKAASVRIRRPKICKLACKA